VGVPGVALELLSPKKLLFGVPPKLSRFCADPPRAFWNNGLPVLGENGEFDVELTMLARGLPDNGDWDARSPWLLKLLRGVDFWYRGGVT
jgi:hypothetical protein